MKKKGINEIKSHKVADITKGYKLFFVLPLLLALLVATGCDETDSAQEGASLLFLQNATSGSVENIDPESSSLASLKEGDRLLLSLNVATNTIFFFNRPVRQAGSMTTEEFVDNFDENFGDVPPNAVLEFENTEGIVTAVPLILSNPVYDSSTGIIEYMASPLEFTPDVYSSSTVEQIKMVGEIESSFGIATLFIDE